MVEFTPKWQCEPNLRIRKVIPALHSRSRVREASLASSLALQQAAGSVDRIVSVPKDLWGQSCS